MTEHDTTPTVPWQGCAKEAGSRGFQMNLSLRCAKLCTANPAIAAELEMLGPQKVLVVYFAYFCPALNQTMDGRVLDSCLLWSCRANHRHSPAGSGSSDRKVGDSRDFRLGQP
jgi:hypothetical protein